MAWNSGAHPRVLAGSTGGGQFTVASSSKASKQSSSKSKGKSTAKAKSTKLSAAKKTRSKGGKTVTVKHGDTLSAIARRSGESLAQLKKDNPGLFSKRHRGGNLIFAGNKVKVRSAATKSAKITSAKKVRSSSTTRRKATARVKKG